MVQCAYAALIEMKTADFEATLSALSLSQRSVLKALALEVTALPYSWGFLERHHLSIGSTQRAIRALLSMDLVEKHAERGYRLTDPVMRDWLVEI